MVQACRPRARMSPAVFSRLAGSRPTRITSAPASAIATAISRPRPRLPPVMKRRFPVNLNRSKMLMALPVPLANLRVRASLLAFRRGITEVANMPPRPVEYRAEANSVTNDVATKGRSMPGSLESVDRADRGGPLRARPRPGGEPVVTAIESTSVRSLRDAHILYSALRCLSCGRGNSIVIQLHDRAKHLLALWLTCHRRAARHLRDQPAHVQSLQHPAHRADSDVAARRHPRSIRTAPLGCRRCGTPAPGGCHPAPPRTTSRPTGWPG